MIILYISLYHIQNNNRRDEILFCLKSNLLNNCIKKIIILNEDFEHEILQSNKIEIISISKRPFFSDFYKYLDPNSNNIIANNDIRFDNSLEKLKFLFLKKGDALALTRRENDGKLLRGEFGDSQDAWIFKGKPDFMLGCNFFMGKLGCDNLFNYLFYKSGYRVLNPSKSIRIYHEHNSNVRSYTKDDSVNGNYLLTKPINMFEFYIFRILLYYISKKGILIIFNSVCIGIFTFCLY